ncbi:Uncharacterized protein APZ42_023215 [Daphnia magna]|uniref:Uncharacterized protein n=1 Tax=Daphnia magna TaxID=35525 RepID=A0A164V4L3_9CRUS|nr:Uncharacterized protein APZ42_023215 [Daphnia magna]
MLLSLHKTASYFSLLNYTIFDGDHPNGTKCISDSDTEGRCKIVIQLSVKNHQPSASHSSSICSCSSQPTINIHHPLYPVLAAFSLPQRLQPWDYK